MVKNRRSLQGNGQLRKKAMTAAERQDLRKKKLREDPEKYANYPLKQKMLMQKKRENMSELQKAERKSKEIQKRRELRQKKKEQKQKVVGSQQAYAAESSLNRAVNRISSHLPKSPRKRKAAVKELVCKVKLNFTKKKRTRPESEKLKTFQIKKIVQGFYNKDDLGRWTPGKAQYVITKDKNEKKVKQKKRYLQMAVGELYQLFKKQNPNIKVSKSVFYSLRPENVLFVSKIPYSTCHCKYHENVFL